MKLLAEELVPGTLVASIQEVSSARYSDVHVLLERRNDYWIAATTCVFEAFHDGTRVIERDNTDQISFCYLDGIFEDARQGKLTIGVVLPDGEEVSP